MKKKMDMVGRALKYAAKVLTRPKKEVPKEHHVGKGTKARLNTAAEKAFFGSQHSD